MKMLVKNKIFIYGALNFAAGDVMRQLQSPFWVYLVGGMISSFVLMQLFGDYEWYDQF